jgi:hypothetical protein
MCHFAVKLWDNKPSSFTHTESMNPLFLILLLEAALGENDILVHKKMPARTMHMSFMPTHSCFYLAQPTATLFTTHMVRHVDSRTVYTWSFATLCPDTSSRTSSTDIHRTLDNTGRKKEECRPLAAPAPERKCKTLDRRRNVGDRPPGKTLSSNSHPVLRARTLSFLLTKYRSALSASSHQATGESIWIF